MRLQACMVKCYTLAVKNINEPELREEGREIKLVALSVFLKRVCNFWRTQSSHQHIMLAVDVSANVRNINTSKVDTCTKCGISQSRLLIISLLSHQEVERKVVAFLQAVTAKWPTAVRGKKLDISKHTWRHLLPFLWWQNHLFVTETLISVIVETKTGILGQTIMFS